MSAPPTSLVCNTVQEFEDFLKSETVIILGEQNGCEYTVETRSDQYLASSSICTDMFSAAELSGARFLLRL